MKASEVTTESKYRVTQWLKPYLLLVASQVELYELKAGLTQWSLVPPINWCLPASVSYLAAPPTRERKSGNYWNIPWSTTPKSCWPMSVLSGDVFQIPGAHSLAHTFVSATVRAKLRAQLWLWSRQRAGSSVSTGELGTRSWLGRGSPTYYIRAKRGVLTARAGPRNVSIAVSIVTRRPFPCEWGGWVRDCARMLISQSARGDCAEGFHFSAVSDLETAHVMRIIGIHGDAAIVEDSSKPSSPVAGDVFHLKKMSLTPTVSRGELHS